MRALGARRPGDDRLVSSRYARRTRGLAASARAPPARGAPVAVAAWPLDFPARCARAFERRAPRRLLIVETEIWPNALAEAFARGVRVAFASARLSERSWGRTRLARAACWPPLPDPRDRRAPRRARPTPRASSRSGVPREAIAVTGNTKFDAVIAAPPPGEREAARAAAGLAPEALVVAWGNLRPGEEGAFAGVAAGLAGMGARARAAARARRRAAASRARGGDRGRGRARGSRLRRLGARPAVACRRLGRTPVVAWSPALGVLRDVYALADVAVVGGTLRCRTAATTPPSRRRSGAPVVVGPHHATTADAVRALVARDAGHVARDPDDAVAAIARWAATPAALARARGAARACAVDSLAGASARTIGFLEARGFWG